MFKTVGGRSARLMAAASGGAASNSSRVSGQAARGWGITRPGLNSPAILSSLFGSVNDIFPLRCPMGDPEKESQWDRWRAGEERPDPEKESRWDLRAESCWMLGWASLYTPWNSGWSGSNRRPELWLVQNRRCCGRCGRKKVRGCSTGVLFIDPLIPGQFPGSRELSLAVDLGRVAEPASWNELWLAVDPGRVAEPISWNAFLLAVGAHWVRLPGRRILIGGWQAASPFAYAAVTSVGPARGVLGWRILLVAVRDVEISWRGRGGQVTVVSRGRGAGSSTQFKYLSNGGRVTSPPRKTTCRPWRVRKYWRESDELRKVPSDGSNHQITARMECRKRFWPGWAICPWSAKREDGSSVLVSASTSCLTVLKYWLWPFLRFTMRKFANDKGLARLPRHSLKVTVRGYVRAILEGSEVWWGGFPGGLFIAHAQSGSGLSLGDRRGRGGGSGRWLAGSSTTGFQYPWSRTPESTSGWNGPRIPFTQPKFRRDSRATFAD